MNKDQNGNIHRLTENKQKIISNWKEPGHEGVHGFWLKKFTSIHGRLVIEMNRCLQGTQVPEWMTKGKTILIQKDPSKGTTPNNYRTITCLPIMWKILTAQIKENIYFSLTSRGLFPEKQKGCHKGSRGTEELLYIDQHVLNKRKRRRKNQAMAWIDNKKTYYGSANLDTTLSQTVQNIIWSHKLHRKDNANLQSGTDSRRKKLSWNKDPKRDFPRRCTITLTIHNSHDAT